VREEKKLSWKQWAKRLSEFVNEMERLFSPDLFIMGGGISKKAENSSVSDHQDGSDRRLAQMRNEAGIIGAAYLAHISTQS
jgi:polyphosphate glucokinase